MDVTFPYRVAVGVGIFAALGIWDYIRHPDNPKRLKEYLFLFGMTLAAMAYGVAHDFVTYSLSRDYYVLGKGIESAANGFNLDVVKLAMKATWSCGLIGAALLLIANNPDRLKRQLPYRTLLKYAAIPLLCSMVAEGVGGAIFCIKAMPLAAGLGWTAVLEVTDEGFFAVWGMHLGAYAGAALGVLMAAVLVVRQKRRMGAEADGQDGRMFWVRA